MIRYVSYLWPTLLIGVFALIINIGLTSSVNAQTLPESTHGLTDVSEIACHLQLGGGASDTKRLDACKQGYVYKNDPTWCDKKDGFDNSQKEACKKGSSESREPASLYCASKFSPSPVGQMYGGGTNSAYAACFGGFRIGEGFCSEHYSDKKDLADACKKGYEGHVAYSDLISTSATGAAASASASASSSAQASKLGPAPRTGNVNKILVPKDKTQIRETCSLEGVLGTMMCGGLDIVGKMADSSLAVLGSFMKVDPLTTDDDNPIYIYWKAFQSIANVLFIIALLAVILSQVSNIGLSVYDVKKMLPRLIVGAVLLNLSYAICTITVDVSNILGATVYDTMRDSIAPSTGVSQQEDRLQVDMKTAPIVNPETYEQENFSSAANAMISAQAISVTEGGAIDSAKRFAGKAMNGALAALLPVIITVLLAIIITVICLLLRQALIIAFIIISPLAFAAFLLPNTKPLFDRWLKSFIPLVMLFPVIAFTFGIGAVVAQIVAAAAFANTNFPVRSLLILMALGIQIVPLIAVPKLMSFGGGLLAQLSNMANSQTAGLNNKAKEHAKKQKEIGDSLAKDDPRWYNWHRRKRFDAKQKDETLESALEETQEKFSKAGKAADAGPRDTSSGSSTSQPEVSTDTPDASETSETPSPLDTSAAAAIGEGLEDHDDTADEPSETADVDEDTSVDVAPMDDTEDNDEVVRAIYARGRGRIQTLEARRDRFKSDATPDDVILSTALGQEEGTSALDQEAAIMRIVADNNIGALLEVAKASGGGNMSRGARQTLVSAINSNKSIKKSAPMLANQEAQDNLVQGNVTSDTFSSTVVAPSLRTDDYSPESITALDDLVGKEINNTLANASSNGVADQTVNDLRHAAARSLDTEKTRRKIGKQLYTINEMAGRPSPGGSS